MFRVRSRGAADVAETWSRFVPSARLEPGRASVAFDWTSLQVAGMSVLHYDLAASVKAGNRPEGQLIACRMVSDNAWVGAEEGDLDAGLPWLASETGVQSRWEGRARVRALVFDTAAAERAARQISGDDRLGLRVLEASPLSASAGRQWERAYRYVLDSLVSIADSDVELPLLEAELERHALMATLTAFPTSFQEAAERSAQRRAAPATVRRAVAYMQDHAAEPITVDDVAQAARISTRGLQYAFRRALGVSPTEYLRDLRLVGAHEELRRVDAAVVRDVARRWGFGSPSRFAAHYRVRYGRTPVQTAREI
ncbi:AraC family transcriptional regulator [Microbacterium sp. 10M-3C3]|jgi:AraC-like DNA-binding protein|uniref:helix-turn-helix transcriptional regulator n=1 Tax=Microbacterium sp. 10M-3C3 TaxID=2483401 RepID=UPI000F636EBF|nr:AraC family transcriptional regulator [Microbacterium sp. 10M-3C3]